MNRPLLTALLAGLLTTGVPALSEESQPQTTEAAAVTSININTADHEQLAMLSGVGPAKAEAIIQYRENNGPFTSVDELSKVRGIGPATIEKNRHLLSH